MAALTLGVERTRLKTDFMAYEQKELTGSLFRNDRQREGKDDPAYTGSCLIQGPRYWISAWTKEKNGKKFFSFSFKPKDGARKPETKSEAEPANDPEIPF